MVKLILEEGGRRRAFELGDGILTVGSGGDAKLRVQSPDVAETHLELEIKGDKVQLRPRPGVLPPSIGGAEVKAPTTMAPGRVVVLGSARLWIEGKAVGADKAPEADTRASRPVPQARTGVGRPRSVAKDRSVAHRTRARVQRGVPSWAIVGMILGAVGLAIFMYSRYTRSAGEKTGASVGARIAAAREHLEAGNLDMAEKRLDLISSAREMTSDERDQVEAFREEIAQRRHQADLDVENLRGTKYLDVKLKNYEAKWLIGEPERPKVRLFLQRCQVFRKRWPHHPEMGWIERQERRFPGYDLSEPPTWDELDWELRYLAEQRTRNYVEVFALLSDFMDDATGEDLLNAQERWDQCVEERIAYHTDKLYQAEWEFNKKDNPDQAVWWLVHLVIWIGDEEMADKAASFLIRMPNLKEHLLAYQRDYPDRYEALLEHPEIRKAAKSEGLL